MKKLNNLFVGLFLVAFILSITNYYGQTQKEAEIINQYKARFSRETNLEETDSNVTKVGQFSWGNCKAVAVRGNYAYIGNGSLFQVLDISDSAKPKVVGEVQTSDELFNIVLVNDKYAIADNPFQVLDIQDPNKPKVVIKENYNIFTTVMVYDSLKHYCYLGALSGIYIIDISKILSPKKIGYIDAGGWVTSIALKGNYLYSGTTLGYSFKVFDISDIQDPVELNYFWTGGVVVILAVEGNYLYESDSRQPNLKVFDISDPGNPVYLGGVNTPSINSPIYINIRDTLAYLSLSGDGLAIVDVKDKVNPTLLSNIRKPTEGLDADQSFIQGKNIFIASLNGLWNVEAVKPDSLKNKFFLFTGGSMYSAAVYKNYCLAGTPDMGLNIFDFSDPSQLKLVNQYTNVTGLLDVKVDSNYAFLLTEKKIIILNISDISNLVEESEIPIDSINSTIDSTSSKPAYNLFTFSDGLMVITDNKLEFAIIDISGIKNPKILRIFPFDENSYSVNKIKLNGRYLYSAQMSGLAIYDLTDPYKKTLEVYSNKNLDIASLNVEGNILAATIGLGLRLFDITNPVEPIELDSISTYGSYGQATGNDIKFSKNNYVYTAYNNNIEIIDISDPNHLELAGYVRDIDAGRIAIKDNLIFNTDVKVSIYRNDLITSVKNIKRYQVKHKYILQQNYPNPFNPVTTIKYTIPAAAENGRSYSLQAQFVTIKIYDVIGREIKTIVNAQQLPGNYKVTFDASNLTSGVYYYRLTAGDFIETRKMLLLK